MSLAIAFTLAGCQGVNNASASPSSAVSVSLNQTSVSIAISTTAQFTATVQNTTNTAVTWSVDGVAGGNSSEGTISASGLYTAPAQAGTHTVTATSVADSTKSAKASVAVGNISLTPASATIAPGGTQQFTATIQGFSNAAINWSVNKVSGGNSTVGTISSSGFYTAPAQTGTYTIVATSAADSSVTASATVTVSSTITISPSAANVAAGTTQQFTATVPGVPNASVTWAVDQIVGGNATVGTISATGLYTAPAAVGNHTITATSTGGAASATVAVFTLSVSPSAATVALSATEQFTATAQGLSAPVFSWSVDTIAGGNSTVGTITTAGLYTAPAQAGTHTIAASVVNASGTASAAVTVISFTVTPSTATVDPSATQQFTAAIQASTETTFSWSVDGVAGGNVTTGTISTSGLYTAPGVLGAHTVTATTTTTPSVSADAAVTVVNLAQAAVLTYHNDDARDGAYMQEVTLTPANVNSTKFGKLFSYSVDGQIYAQPLYLPQISIAGGTHDVVYVETQNNSVYAFDATGVQTTPFWQVNLGAPVTKNDYSGVSPVVGILSTPVIDSTTNTMYVFSESSGGDGPFHLHALDVATGAEKFGGPVLVTGTVPGTGGESSGGNITLGTDCYQRMGLALNPVTNAIYIPFGSCAHGWVLAYDKTALAQTAIFNDTPDGDGGGLWASGGAPAIDDTTGDLYLMSGVDELSPGVGDPVTNGYNDSFLRLDPTNLSVLDYFTPDDNFTLAANDVDLGAGSNILVPNNTSSTPHETIGGGKDGNIFVVNRDKMGGYNPPPVDTNNVIQTVQTGTQQYNNIFSTPVYWNGSIYYHCNQDVLRAFSWNASTGLLSTTATSKATPVYGMHGATASLSSNGATNGIIWDIDNSAYVDTGTGSGPSILHAYDATNVATELYNSSQAGSRDTAGAALKFTVPTIAGGRVFVPTSTELDVYGLLP
ncbi:MAG TPA: Ig-like domain-containing protein [Candidatus Sulfotelmatobacter sp.]|nr:Ig-like domain-containing protein [Candidatus Sulfotelmatobacter sp.]